VPAFLLAIPEILEKTSARITNISPGITNNRAGITKIREGITKIWEKMVMFPEILIDSC
jgi:hypothetical protein